MTRIGVALVAFVIASAVASPASATTPQALTITQHASRGCVIPCTFVATGAINDAGSMHTVSFHASALPSPVVGVAQWIYEFDGADGSFILQVEAHDMGMVSPVAIHETDHWVVTDGTGAYANFRGSGTAEGTRNFAQQTLDLVYSGKVQL
jgi:hypothetical protein